MKKYIIGLFSAICLMWAGCEQFEDFVPVDMGEGPAVTVDLKKTDVDAFTLTVTPAEGAAYYAYLITNEAITANSDTLLQAKYANAVPLKTAENPSVTESFVNQKIGVTYYVYAVASDAKGVCGAIASATLDLPDEEAPHIVDASYMYTPTNNSRTITVTFNEEVIRGTGAITYSLNTMNSDNTFNVYKSGTFGSENVVIDGTKVAITLPEDAVYNETENTVTFVFLTMEKGAFVDASGNESPEMAGFDEDSAPLFPWWQYVPGATGGDSDIEIEIDDAKGYGIYRINYTSLLDQEDYYEGLTMYRGADIEVESDYAVVGFGGYLYDDGAKYGYLTADVAEGAFNLYHRYMVGSTTVQGTQYALAVFGVIYDEATGKITGLIDSDVVPFVPNAELPLVLETDVVMAYGACNPSSGAVVGFLEVMEDCKLLPESLVQSASVEQSFTPSINKAMKANAIKKYLEANQGNFKMKTLKK